MDLAAFDTSTTVHFNESRRDFLETFLPGLVSRHHVETAVDVGCGFGFFSSYLQRIGLTLTAVDARAENVEECKKRMPEIEFATWDVEDPGITSLGPRDLVFCFGLLYHLENPLLGLRHLARLTGKVLLIETVISPGNSTTAELYEEDPREDQGLNYIALIPTESWFIKALYRVGFPFVYATRELPHHAYYQASLIKRRKRTILIASREELSSPLLWNATEPKTNRHMWDSPVVAPIARSERLRNILRGGLRLLTRAPSNGRPNGSRGRVR